MKKILMILFAMLMTVNVYSQHMKFMGVPIDGNINSFAAKMAAKGFTISPRNRYTGSGIRVMRGIFFDQSADIWISYNTTTKIVYSVLVQFYSDDRSVCESFMKEIKGVIEDKYMYIPETGKTKSGNDIDIYLIVNDDKIYLGQIYIGISEETEYFGYHLNLTYEDFKNSERNNSKKNNDI